MNMCETDETITIPGTTLTLYLWDIENGFNMHNDVEGMMVTIHQQHPGHENQDGEIREFLIARGYSEVVLG